MKKTIIAIVAVVTVALCSYYAGAQKSESEYLEMLEMKNAETALLQIRNVLSPHNNAAQ